MKQINTDQAVEAVYRRIAEPHSWFSRAGMDVMSPQVDINFYGRSRFGDFQ